MKFTWRVLNGALGSLPRVLPFAPKTSGAPGAMVYCGGRVLWVSGERLRAAPWENLRPLTISATVSSAKCLLVGGGGAAVSSLLPPAESSLTLGHHDASTGIPPAVENV